MNSMASDAQPRRGRWIPWTFVFGFAVVVAVNATMITYAVTSFSGLATANPYERGLAYNRVLEEQDRQAALGWTLAPAFAAGRAGTNAGEITLRATRADGTPLAGLSVTVELTRPLEAIAPIDLALREVGEGVYRAGVTLPRGGQWDLHVIATAGGDRRDLRQRIYAR
ncbi:MAG: FixH family protein [Alphaproteobacteria bacterium]|nr:FixH family protein [Alphaproteobacteria bacterium]